MANLRRFTLKDDWKDWDITLEVNLDQLTAERATLINEFWSGHDDRLDDANGDVVDAVIKLAAERLVYAFLERGGAHVSDGAQSKIWTQQDLHDQEGWGGTEDGNPFGWCGIRLVTADVQVDLDLEFQED
ncbi:DUF2528 family protein [Pseudomonas nicosulfuronedens]|uniref:DUF2528 family protein n=1 Tax=Pseudomonas nicosulfuronedens TaxID=2571105 RepID=UPI00244C71DC|nr:DUF2528 family protein [Pseudomonas nicosulfuronedens]MDH1007392.1 DUF2528 family protein [Pseudomonas nicosulfuronedens]MDH1977438.1 DUF2528 family protein [Pseudomonas nicosulfuronedens]MDH2029036.1 DUF2528 family protein [Pseudomonas nicosulfuronedens]